MKKEERRVEEEHSNSFKNTIKFNENNEDSEQEIYRGIKNLMIEENKCLDKINEENYSDYFYGIDLEEDDVNMNKIRKKKRKVNRRRNYKKR